MSNQLKSVFIAFSLALLGIFLIFYKVNIVGMPFMPDETRSVYEIDAQIDFKGTGKPVLVSLALPAQQAGMKIISEDASSAGYGFTTANTNSGKRAEWAKRRVSGKQTLYYSIKVLKEPIKKM